MPPRRRKKSSQHRKRPLIFTESPVSIYHGIPSPVAGARNPPTADVVSVDEGKLWFSPQFQPPNSTRAPRRRITRSRTRNQIQNESNMATDSSGAGSSKITKIKYKSLKFFGDPSAVDSPLMEISYHSQDGSRTVRANGTSAEVENETEVNNSVERLPAGRTSLTKHFSALTMEHRMSENGESSLNAHAGESPMNCCDITKSPVTHFRGDAENKKPAKRLFSTQLSNSHTPRRSQRLVTKQRFFDVMSGTPLVSRRDRCRVLVEETPDCDKGLTVIERRRRLLKRTANAMRV